MTLKSNFPTYMKGENKHCDKLKSIIEKISDSVVLVVKLCTRKGGEIRDRLY